MQHPFLRKKRPLVRSWKKDIFALSVTEVELTYNKMFFASKKLHRHFFTFHYYLLLPKIDKEFSEE